MALSVFAIVRTREVVDAITYYRIAAPTSQMANNGVNIVYMDRFMARSNLRGVSMGPPTAGYDVYVSCRLYSEENEDFLDLVHEEGGVFVFDSDDDLTEDYRLVSGRGDVFKQTLGDADYVTTSTPELALHFSQWTRQPPIVLPNHIDVEAFSRIADERRRLYGGITVGFSGTRTHFQDWYIPAVPWVKIAEKYPEVNPLIHGDPPQYLGYCGPLLMGPDLYKDYPKSLKQFDILICALRLDDGFNRGKSAVKALEAMTAGAVAVCSKSPAYVRLAEAGAPVVLVEEETRSCWYATLEKLVVDEAYRLDLQSRGRPWVKEHRDIADGYKLWVEAYEEMRHEGV